MKTNEELQTDVQDAIKWEPLLNAAEIGVTVKDGVVTLSGVVSNYSKKGEAENAAKSVKGVKAVIEEIKVVFPGWSGMLSSDEIVQEVCNTLNKNDDIPKDTVKIKIENGWVTLEGDLKWNYQREAACIAVSKTPGVVGIYNNILLKPEQYDDVEREGIVNALSRNTLIDSDDIEIEITGDTVRLKGIVGSWYQKKEASKVAWNAPGVRCVENDLTIKDDWLVY